MSDKTAEMWAALEAYQPKADADGHGDSWRVMYEKRTYDTMWAAYRAAPKGSTAKAAAARADAAEAAWASAATAAATADAYAQDAIDAIREVQS